MHRYIYKIHAIPPSNNKYIGRNAWKEYRNIKQKWELVVKASCKPKPEKPLEHARITLRYTFPDRKRRDPDNYSGKMLLDGLVKAGIIVDDNFNRIILCLQANYRKGESCTEIIVEEVKNE